MALQWIKTIGKQITLYISNTLFFFALWIWIIMEFYKIRDNKYDSSKKN
jgi:hypothetical protein